MGQADARPDMRRCGSVGNKQQEINYNTSGWTVVALRSRVIPSSQNLSTQYFAGTNA